MREISNCWVIDTSQGVFKCKYLIWAAGEFQNPQIKNLAGHTHAIHSSLIKKPSELKGEDYTIIGGYESGVQIAAELIKHNKKVTLINPTKIDQMDTSDPSKFMSLYTLLKYVSIKIRLIILKL